MLSANIQSFLTLGYFLDYPSPRVAVDVSGVRKDRYRGVAEEDLLVEGATLLTKAVSTRFRSGESHCVPLSGGLDSRVILGELMKHTETAAINTFTFGTPGSLDFDLGNAVAMAAGTNHTAFDLTSHRYAVDELVDVSRRSDHQTLLFLHPPMAELDHRFGGCVLWSGFLGGELAGAHLPAEPARSLAEAKRQFLRRNTLVDSYVLEEHDEESIAALLDFDGPGNSDITLEEQLDYRNRQPKFIAPHLLLHGFRYETPFLDSGMINFLVGVPDGIRRNRALYKRLVACCSPDLFRVGAKASYGGRLGGVSPGRRAVCWLRRVLSHRVSFVVDPATNYIEFAKAIRSRDDVRQTVRNAISDLKARGIAGLVDPERLWQAHQAGKTDHAFALLALCSLEIHLKAGKKA